MTVKSRQVTVSATSNKKKSSNTANSQEFSLSSLLRQATRQQHAALHVETLHPGAVFVGRHFMTDAECQAFIHAAETIGDMERVAHPATRYVAQRECGRWQRNDIDAANKLFQRLSTTILPKISQQLDFPRDYFPVACNSNLRLYKYEKGMSFGKHYDGSDSVAEGQTEITVLVYLSTCVGGVTRFYPPHRKQSFAFAPEKGAILLHIHGDRCLAHEADAVVQGIKYVLRTDIVYARRC
jgi:2OG-Fe(II) oxygenase superfamily